MRRFCRDPDQIGGNFRAEAGKMGLPAGRGTFAGREVSMNEEQLWQPVRESWVRRVRGRLRGRFDQLRSMLRDDGSNPYPGFLYFPPHG
jgi:hypothetical protein